MKGESKELNIIDITLEDFKKLNLCGYRQTRKYYKKDDDSEVNYDETIETLKDSCGGSHIVSLGGFYSKIVWEKVNLSNIVEENIEFSKEEGWTKPICLAIHTEVTNSDLEKARKTYIGIKDDEEAILGMCLFEKSYLDKFLTRSGPQTYLIRCDVEHLYSRRNYFYTVDDYFDIPKKETKAVYLIRF